jgi:HD domain
MRNILDIYKEYRIPANLQAHQLRVAGVAMMICENSSLDIDKKSFITACLLHDMGNIVRFNLERFPEYNEPEGLNYWQDVQNEYKAKYGTNEHEATLAIMAELGVPDSVSSFIKGTDLLAERDNIEDVPFPKKIFCYVDNRVAIYGVASMDEKNKDYESRYSHEPDITRHTVNRRRNLSEIEQEVFTYCSIKPEDIHSASVDKRIEILKEFNI